MKNFERYKNDLRQLIERGVSLQSAIQYECFKKEFIKTAKEQLGDEAEQFLNDLPNFSKQYQIWYSEAKVLVRQLLPDRLDDFVDYYEKPKTRKEATFESYRISDYLLGLTVTREYPKVKVVGPEAAIPKFEQQLTIVKAAEHRFESSLFDIKQLVQADLFDSELEGAKSLVKHGFLRAGGAIAGVVMERHLAQVCENHAIKLRKKAPVIADFNEALKKENVIDIPQWRAIQHLADIRNLCDHNKDKGPTDQQVTELVEGVMKLTKTLF